MKIIEFFAKKAILVNLLAVFVTVAGIYVFITSPKEALPEIDLGFVVVQTIYPDAAPAEVEKLVTIPIEEAVEDIKGIDEIVSSSSEGISIVTLTLKPNINDTVSVVNDIKGAIDKIRDFPTDAEDPDVTELTTDEFPVIQLAISGGKDYAELRESAKNIEKELLKIPGVSAIDKIGYLHKTIWVETGAEKLSYYGVTVFNIINSLRNRNISMPAGNKVFDGYENSIRALAEISNADDVKKVIVRSNDVGRAVFVKDTADVYEGFADADYITRADGHDAIVFTVLKSTGADTIRIADRVRYMVSKMKKDLPENISTDFSNDSSSFVKDRLSVVYSNGAAGAILVLAVLLFMLRPSIAVMTAVGLPVAFGMALLILKLLGISYNMLSLFGFVMVLGMLVDNAIVVGENVYRHIEMGKSSMQASIEGSTEMIIPVIASVATTVAAFFPLLMVGGVLGGFLSPIPTAIIITILASLLECYFVLPSHLATFGGFGGAGKFTEKQENFTSKLREKYTSLLEKVLKKRWRFTLIVLAFFVLAVFLGGLRGIEFFTQETDAVNITVKADTEYSLLETDEVVKDIEKKVRENVGKEDLETVFSYVGQIPSNQGQPETGTNLARVEVYLKLKAQRKTKDSEVVINTIRDAIGKPEGVKEIKVEGVSREGGPARNAIDFAIVGESYADLDKAASELISSIKGIEGVKELSSDLEQGKREIRLMLNEKKAAQAGIALSDISIMLRGAIAGLKVASIKRGGEDIDIVVKAADKDIKSIDDMLDLKVPNRMGGAVPLRSLASIEKGYSYTVLRHRDTKKAVTVTGSIDKKKTNVSRVNFEILKRIKELEKKHPAVEFVTGGEFKEQNENFADLGNAFLAALFLIFIILATLFNSLIQPFIIMLAIPLGFMGVMLTLAIHGMPISFGAFMGFVGLSGVVVNNSLILTDFINKSLKEGMKFEDAILNAAKTRLRPIILTTVTTAVGLLPLGYGVFGANDPFLKPVALVFAWGLVFSAVVTLFMIPVFTVMMHNLWITMKRIPKKDKIQEYAFRKKS